MLRRSSTSFITRLSLQSSSLSSSLSLLLRQQRVPYYYNSNYYFSTSTTLRSRKASGGSNDSSSNNDAKIYAVAGATLVGLYLALVAYNESPSNIKKRIEELSPNKTKYLKRINNPVARANWKDENDKVGFPFSDFPGVHWPTELPLFEPWAHDSYWNEESYYQVSVQGMWEIEKASFDIHSMCLQVVQDVVDSDELLQEFGIPQQLWYAIRQSWKERQVDLGGRLDLLWNGIDPPKLAEYNADTPTVLVETAGAQKLWYFHQEQNNNDGTENRTQFNVLQEALQNAFVELQNDFHRELTEHDKDKKYSNNNDDAVNNNTDSLMPPLRTVFTTQGATPEFQFLEERATTEYVKNCAKAAGISDAKMIDLEELDNPQVFEQVLMHASTFSKQLSVPAVPNVYIWKLYPYEWLIQEQLGIAMTAPEFWQPGSNVRWIEPPWKLILSSKAILAYLWKKFPNHPNLLASFNSEKEFKDYLIKRNQYWYFSSDNDDSNRTQWVAKPRFGREGVGIVYSHDYETVEEFLQAVKKQSNEDGQLVISDFTPSLATYPQSYTSIANTTNINDGISSTNLSKAATDFVKSLTSTSGNPAAAAGSIASVLDREWGSRHAPTANFYYNNGTFGYNLGKPIFQEYFAPASLSGRTILTSCWIVRGVPAAVCFREDIAMTTNDDSSFVPHVVVGEFGENGPTTMKYPLNNKQKKIRSQLYGTLPLTRDKKYNPQAQQQSTTEKQKHSEIGNNNNNDDDENFMHPTIKLENDKDPTRSQRSYSDNGGFAGMGTAPVGGGGPKMKQNSSFVDRLFPSSSDSNTSGGNYGGGFRYGSSAWKQPSTNTAAAASSSGSKGKDSTRESRHRPHKPNRTKFGSGTTARGAAYHGRSYRS